MMVVTGFTSIFWGTGVQPVTEAFATSGSSLFTLGFVRPQGAPRIVLEFVEAGFGLGLVSLMISYLPTIYGAFSRREALVGMLEVRAGLPPSPAAAADPIHANRLARPHRRRSLRAMGGVVRRHRGEPHQPAVAGVLPLAASGAKLDHRGRLRARHRRRSSRRRSIGRATPSCDLMIRSGFLCAAADRRRVPDPVRPRSATHGPDHGLTARVRPVVRSSCARSTCR